MFVFIVIYHSILVHCAIQCRTLFIQTIYNSWLGGHFKICEIANKNIKNVMLGRSWQECLFTIMSQYRKAGHSLV